MNEVGIRLKVIADGLQTIQQLEKDLAAVGGNTKALEAAAAALNGQLDKLIAATGGAVMRTTELGASAQQAGAGLRADAVATEQLTAATTATTAAVTQASGAMAQEGQAALRAAEGNTAAAAAGRAHAESAATQSAGLGSLIGRAAGWYAAITQMIGATKELILAEVGLDRLRRVLTTVTGSSAEANKQIEFLRQVAQKTGQSFTAVGEEYGKFVAAAKASGIPLSVVQDVFTGVAYAAGNLGLSSERTGLILNALGQMASKGTVQMEELRGQLGDSLPGAMSLLAKSLGITDAQLIKLVESGGLLARDALPALAKALLEAAATAGPIDGLTVAWNRFWNVIKEGGTIVGEGGLGKVIGVILNGFTAMGRIVSVVTVQISEGFGVVFKTFELLGTALSRGTSGFKTFGDEVKKAVDDAGAKIDKFRDRAYEGTNAAKDWGTAVAGATPAVKAHGEALQVASVAGQAASAAQTQVATATGAASAASAAATTATTTATTATTASTAAASTAVAGWVALKLAYLEQSTAAQKAAEVAAVLVKAKEEEGKGSIAIAKLSGDEVAVRQANTKAATETAAAVNVQADAEEKHAKVLIAERDALVKVIFAEGGRNEDRKKELETLQNQVNMQSAVAEKLKQTAAAHDQEAAAARQAADTAKDNTFRYGELNLKLTEARQALSEVRIAMSYGIATAKDLETAETNVAKAIGLVKDAITDTDHHLKDYLATKKADTAITVGGLQVKLEEQKTLERFATLHGNETQALVAKIEQKRIELLIAQASAKAKADEATETVRATRETKAELDALGQLTPEKRRELDLRIQNAQALLLEAQREGLATSKIKEEIAALQNLRDAFNGAAAARQNLTNAPPAGIVHDPYAGFGKSTGGGGGGGGGGNIATGPVDNSYIFTLRDRLQRGDSFGANEIPAIENALRAAQDNARMMGSSSVQSLEGNSDIAMWAATLRRALEQAQGAAAVAAAQSNTTLSGNGAGSGNNRNSGNTSHTVTISLPGGRSTTINAASAADASSLANLMQQLQDLAARSGH